MQNGFLLDQTINVALQAGYHAQRTAAYLGNSLSSKVVVDQGHADEHL